MGVLLESIEKLGSISYPARTATQLRVGGIIQEGYLLQLPDNLPDFASVNVRIYSDEANDTPPVRLFDVGFDKGTVPFQHFGEDSLFYDIGEDEELRAMVNQPALENGSVMIQAFWLANQQIYEDYVIFIQVLDSEGNLVVGDDSPLLDEARTTSSFHPDSAGIQ